MRAISIALALTLGHVAVPLRAAEPAKPDLERVAARITGASAYQTVETLAGPSMQGRLSGTDGYRRAAEWVIGELRKAGLRAPEGLPDFRQRFTHAYAGLEAAALDVLPLAADKDGKPAQAKLLEDFAPMLNSGSGDVTAEVVFVGYGFNAPDLGRDDYAGVDVKGKVVLALRGEPEAGDWKEHRSSAARTKAAARLGAAALLLVDSAVTSTSIEVDRSIPAALVSSGFADRLLADQKLATGELRKVLARGGTASFATGRRVQFRLAGRPWQELETHNVVAVLLGSDPALRGEYVLLGAHLDHIGDWPRVNPGADDNASGSATLLEIARAVAAAGPRPRRSLVFVWFAAEELGLRGARHFADHPPAGLGTCVALLNMDMLAVGTGVYVAGGDNFPQIRSALEQARDLLAPGFGIRSGLVRGEARADHGPFFDKGIAAVSLFSTGAHHGYHTPEDTTYWVTPKTMESAGRIVLGAAWTLADAR